MIISYQCLCCKIYDDIDINFFIHQQNLSAATLEYFLRIINSFSKVIFSFFEHQRFSYKAARYTPVATFLLLITYMTMMLFVVLCVENFREIFNLADLGSKLCEKDINKIIKIRTARTFVRC